MFTIGLTGGIGSGKSTVAGVLNDLGAKLVDADRVGWEVYRTGTGGYRSVVDEFGEEVVGPDGEIDRKRLGSIVFGDPARMEALTGIVWPLIAGAVADRIGEEAARGTLILVVEAAVLFEAGWENLFDEIWVVTAREEMAVERLISRDGVTAESVLARVAAQIPDEERVRRADAVIDNGGDLTGLRRSVESVWRERTTGKA
ncbi:MAG: dephospho-CoA kinase [Chloroflexi bacterium]|nr:dephospho-CoA kinase [Chloroflexota bacterium]